MVKLINILREQIASMLSEIEFDVTKASKYKWKKDPSGTRYTFNTSEEGKDGTEYEVVFEPHSSDEDEKFKTYERMYNPVGKGYEMTGEGNALKVNATVMDITMDFITNNKDWYDIIISPIESKRLNIVRKFIQQNVPKSKYNVEEEEGILTITKKLYAMPKEKPAKKLKRKPYAAQ